MSKLKGLRSVVDVSYGGLQTGRSEGPLVMGLELGFSDVGLEYGSDHYSRFFRSSGPLSFGKLA